ncbi:MAG: HNH endonuclease [Caldilineaceae bacterium]
MNQHYPLVALRARHRCEYCHAPESVFNFPFEIEHIMPLALGGLDDEVNLALACRACNLYKGKRITGVDAEVEGSVPFFHPREQQWEDHFRVDLATGVLVGLSSVARATINSLHLNSRSQLLARQQWIQLGVFP